MKTYFFSGLNLNRIIQKKNCQNKEHYMDDAFESKEHCIFKC